MYLDTSLELSDFFMCGVPVRLQRVHLSPHVRKLADKLLVFCCRYHVRMYINKRTCTCISRSVFLCNSLFVK